MQPAGQQYNPRSQSNQQLRQGQGSRSNLPVEGDSFMPTTFRHESGERNTAADTFYGGTLTVFGQMLGCVGSIPCCFCFSNPYKQIQQGYVGLFSSFGKYVRTVDAGLAYYNLLTEQLYVVDVRQQAIDMQRQSALTSDNVTVSVDSVLFFRIDQPARAIFEVQDVSKSIVERAATTLREACGKHDLQDLITNRESVSREIMNSISGVAKSWGVSIEAILLKDVIFDEKLQESFGAVALQRRIGASKIVAAESENQAAKLLQSTAKLSMQIRYLDTLKQISREAGTKVVFMPPMEGSFNGEGGEIQHVSDDKKPFEAMKKTVMNDVMSNF